MISPALRRLYADAPPEIHDTIFPAVIGTLKNILLFHAAADSMLIPFYRARSMDSSLRPKNRAKAALALANFYAHIARDADSADDYLAHAQQYQA